LAKWSSNWRGRETELRYVPGNSLDGAYEAGLGTNLISALATGQAWLTTEAEFDRLLDFSVTPEQRQMAQQLLASSRQLDVSLSIASPPQFQIAQYSNLSTRSAIAKLKQYPSGARFVWQGNLQNSNEQRVLDELRQAVTASGIRIVEPQTPSVPPS
jgi:hypothetical protein